jgi:hypothetical protein
MGETVTVDEWIKTKSVIRDHFGGKRRLPANPPMSLPWHIKMIPV